ncbi:MAG: cytochrome c [Woeseiaceae bacterium]|jgi:nitric oxide reductase subunit C|nr:cytochrome c [Woeseiaceae bacterium]
MAELCSGPANLWGDGKINNRLVFGTLFVAFLFYSATVYTSGTAAVHGEPMSEEARQGLQIFQNENCIACHQFYGLGGYMGPDLTNVISTSGEAYARAFITAGTARMPNFNLREDEVSALVAFLGFVDQTGTYPPKKYEVHWTGAVAQEDDPQ